LPVENGIGGVVHKRNARARGQGGNFAGQFGVQAGGQSGLALAGFQVCRGGSMHYGVGAGHAEGSLGSALNGKVQRKHPKRGARQGATPHAHDFMPGLQGFPRQVDAQQARNAGEEQPHHTSP